MARTWAERLCRRWAVRYRSRRHPAQATPTTSTDTTTTSGPQARRQLITMHQFSVCRRRDVATADRLVAVLLCWYLARVDSVHHGLGLTYTGVSWQLRLAVAVVLVSVLMLALATCVVAGLRLVWSALSVVVCSLLHFTLLLVAVLAGALAALTLAASFQSSAV